MSKSEYAVKRRFDGLLQEAFEHYLTQVRRIEARRQVALKNVRECDAFAEWMIERYGVGRGTRVG